MQNKTPVVVVLGTGGTIAGTASSASDNVGYTAAQLGAADLVKAINAAEKTLLRDVSIFDVYTGKGVADGKKSIALTVTLQADDRTLTDGEIDAVAKAIIASAMKAGAVLR